MVQPDEFVRYYKDLLTGCAGCDSLLAQDRIRQALRFAFDAHHGMVRKSGEPYIIHPIEVAKITASLIPGDVDAIAAALLHDVVEDNETISHADIQAHFGEDVARMVEGLTKISRIDAGDESQQTANFQKLILTIEVDYRIIFIKLADRLHNMRTLLVMPEKNRVKTCSETLYFYAPIAERVGLYNVKVELENLALQIQDPEAYEHIRAKVGAINHLLDESISTFAEPIFEVLKRIGVRFDVQRRQKSIYSIWRKMQRKKITFEEVYDLLAMRIVFEPLPYIPEPTQCWFIYSILTDIYNVQRERTRDWITTPKVNGYQALHCTLMSQQGEWVEVQIRTERMHEIAEKGLAAHWKYKKEAQVGQESEIDALREDIQRARADGISDPTAFVNHVKASIFERKINVLDREGSPHAIPRGATVLDFAYYLSPVVGNRALGATIDGVLTNLNHVLRGGEMVTIITAQSQSPSRKWLDYVKTHKARNAIDQSLSEQRAIRIAQGKRRLFQIIDGLDAYFTDAQLDSVARTFEVNSLQELCVGISDGNINLDRLSRTLRRRYYYWPTRIRRRQPERSPLPEVDSPEQHACSLRHYLQASCCFALPGDQVIGYNRDPDTVIVHQKVCPEAERLSAQQADQIEAMPVWEIIPGRTYTAHLYMQGNEQEGVLKSVFDTLFEVGRPVNVTNVHMRSKPTSFEGVISLSVESREELENNLSRIRSLPNIVRVVRVDSPYLAGEY